jgi:protein-S-isoprenylcysteine O-methyltransferase Ste14
LTYWQGWTFFLTFSLSVTLITLYFLKVDPKLIESRLKVGTTAETQKSQKIIQAFASLFFIAVIIFPGIDHHFGWSHVPPQVSILGDILVALGLFIVFLVFKENTYTSAIIEVGEQQKVISSGPYALIRHPMYAGAFIMLIGLPLALESWWALGFTFLLCGAIVWRLLEEEKYLILNLKGYNNYLKKVKYRLIPYIW